MNPRTVLAFAGVILVAATLALATLLGLPAILNRSTTAQPSPISTRFITPIASLVDARIAEYEAKYDFDFMNKSCEAPCHNVIFNRADHKAIRLDDFIVRFGPPEKAIALIVGADPPNFAAELFYISKGVFVLADRPIDARNEITPEMVIGQFHLLKSRIKDEYITEMQQSFGITRGILEAQDWTGFGPIKVLNR